MTDFEKILGPAIRVIEDNCIEANIYYLMSPYTHSDIKINEYDAIGVKVRKINIEYTDGIRMTDGFHTNKRAFINRTQAMIVAKLAYQIKHPWEENGNALFTNYLKGY